LTHPLSVFNFGDDADADPGVDHGEVDEVDGLLAKGGVVAVAGAFTFGAVASPTAGVSTPGVDDNSSLVVVLLLVFVLVGEEGTSESLGKLSVYRTLA
jgi:hypothetical protein